MLALLLLLHGFCEMDHLDCRGEIAENCWSGVQATRLVFSTRVITVSACFECSSLIIGRLPREGLCVCVSVLHINLSGPNQSVVADPVRGLLDSREKSKTAQDKNKRPSSIEKTKTKTKTEEK